CPMHVSEFPRFASHLLKSTRTTLRYKDFYFFWNGLLEKLSKGTFSGTELFAAAWDELLKSPPEMFGVCYLCISVLPLCFDCPQCREYLLAEQSTSGPYTPVHVIPPSLHYAKESSLHVWYATLFQTSDEGAILFILVNESSKLMSGYGVHAQIRKNSLD